MKKYQVIYADPPWPHKSGSEHKIVSYPTMTIPEICCLKVSDICADDCVLFLWTTDKYLPAALKVMEAWGFRYVTIGFVWLKLTVNNLISWMVGGWTVKATEICLLGTKGSPTKLLRFKPKQFVKAQRTIHSGKPEVIRKSIDKMFGSIPRIELFARKRSPGWDVWGNEVKCDIRF